MQRIDRIMPSHSDSLAAKTTALRKALHVENASDTLDNSLNELEKSLEGLFDTLTPLLAEDSALAAGAMEDRARGNCDLAEHTLQQADRVDRVAERIRDMINRL